MAGRGYRWSERADVLGLWTLGVLNNIKLNFLVLLQGAVDAAADGRIVAKTSADPLSGAMKPKPFSALNHLNVPVAMAVFLYETVIHRQRGEAAAGDVVVRGPDARGGIASGQG